MSKIYIKKQYILGLLVGLVILTGLITASLNRSSSRIENQPETATTKKIQLIADGERRSFNVEIADDPLEREIGLMNRKSLDKASGMLFVFPDEAERNFWMKNTLIPLDMLFFDANKKFLGIIRNAEPCPPKETNCKIYSFAQKAKYVLELNAFALDENFTKNEMYFLLEE